MLHNFIDVREHGNETPASTNGVELLLGTVEWLFVSQEQVCPTNFISNNQSVGGMNKRGRGFLSNLPFWFNAERLKNLAAKVDIL